MGCVWRKSLETPMNADKNAPMNADDHGKFLKLILNQSCSKSRRTSISLSSSIGVHRRAFIGVHRRFQRFAFA
jgi:hypothetical protein